LQNAELQYFNQTEHGKIEVYQNQRYRWLCLNGTLQTMMDCTKPERLVLPHLHALAIAFYFKPSASLIIELGLGGGALPRHIKKHFPHTELLSAEIEPAIIDCFKRFFIGNIQSEKHTIEQADACQFMQTKRQSDILFIDLFGENAAPPFLNREAFYADCFSNLKDDGLLVLNLLPNHPFQPEQLKRMLGELSGQKTLILSIPGYKNRIVFASKQAIPPLRYNDNINEFAKEHHIDLLSFIQMN
jgi:spermidine synthase